MKVVCKAPRHSRPDQLIRKGKQVASARVKNGRAVLRVRPGRYRLKLVDDGRVIKRMKLRVRQND